MSDDQQQVPIFVDDFDGDAEVAVYWEEGYVTVVVAEPGGDSPAPIALCPAKARRLAMDISLASFRADGENTAEMEETVRKLEDGDPDAPVEYTVTADVEKVTTESVWEKARELAGADASVGEVTDLARFLVTAE